MDQSPIIGSWRLARTRATDDDGSPIQPPFGPEPIGLITFTPAGRMMATLCDGRAAAEPGGAREFSAYCGSYSFDGETLVVRVDGATEPERVGGDQVRRVECRGDRMALFPPPLPTATGNQHREFFWERIA